MNEFRDHDRDRSEDEDAFDNKLVGIDHYELLRIFQGPHIKNLSDRDLISLFEDVFGLTVAGHRDRARVLELIAAASMTWDEFLESYTVDSLGKHHVLHLLRAHCRLQSPCEDPNSFQKADSKLVPYLDNLHLDDFHVGEPTLAQQMLYRAGEDCNEREGYDGAFKQQHEEDYQQEADSTLAALEDALLRPVQPRAVNNAQEAGAVALLKFFSMTDEELEAYSAFEEPVVEIVDLADDDDDDEAPMTDEEWDVYLQTSGDEILELPRIVW